MPLVIRKERFEQGVAELFEFALGPHLHRTGTAARDDLKVRELNLEGDRAAAHTGALAIPTPCRQFLEAHHARIYS